MMLDPAVANLNTGSFGPLPRPVFDHATRLRRRLAEEPMDFLVRQSPPLLWESRRRLAEFLGGEPSRLVFTANVTASINIVAASLALSTPGEILLTDHEYGAMHWCWERAARCQGLTLRTFALPETPQSPAEIVDSTCAAFTEHTRLLFFSHVLSPTGMVLPVRELCAEARRRGIVTVVDGAHAPAMVPVRLDQTGCDFYGGNCHKWLLAPTGAGFLYMAPGSEERVRPLQVSWGWHHERSRIDDRDEFGSTPRIRALEFEGTRDCCAWLSVPKAIDFQEELGWDHICKHNLALGGYVREQFSTLRGLRPVTPDHPELSGFMSAFRILKPVNPVDLRRELWEKHRIEVPIIERPDCLLVRVSTHFYNTQEEINRLVKALTGLLNSA
jgi:isopenicillin-N epimerase